MSTEQFVFGALSVALLLAAFRLVRGPSLPDRVVALELVSLLVVGMIATYAIDTGQRVLLDVAIAMALITFLGTVAFAKFLEKGA